MGTASFAVESVKILFEEGYLIKAVVTAPDKPAGRGQQIKYSPVKEFALQHQIPLLQPQKLNDPEFTSQLKALRPDIQIVVAFRILPKSVWEIPSLGTFNLHASLLPQYRGAAPINHALINGEKETGVSTFFIDEKIDTGEIISQEKISIGPNETAGELHDRLMVHGSELVLKTVRLIQEGNYKLINQSILLKSDSKLNPAPKIFKEDCQINWQLNVIPINNFIRGLSPYPAAFSFLNLADGSKKMIKVFQAEPVQCETIPFNGSFDSDGRSFFRIKGNDGYVSLLEIQLEGKKKMPIKDFLRGFNVETIKIID